MASLKRLNRDQRLAFPHNDLTASTVKRWEREDLKIARVYREQLVAQERSLKGSLKSEKWNALAFVLSVARRFGHFSFGYWLRGK